jgi:DNA ligase-1
LIPEFTLQLCDKFKPGMDLSYWIVEPKYDGLRCVMIFSKGEGVVLSRNGKPLYNVGHIVEELLPLVKEGVLDGEIYGSDWADSASTFRASKATKTSESGKFHMFDYLTLEDFKNRTCKKTWLNRKAELDHIPDTEHAIKVRSQIVENTEQAWDKAKEFLEQGFEGAVAKNPASHYSFDRNLDWVKLKFSDTYDVVILDTEEGTGRNKGRLGAFICKYKNNKVKVGGGYTDKEREDFWKDKQKYIGLTLECAAQEVTKDDSLRFPVYKRIRHDK